MPTIGNDPTSRAFQTPANPSQLHRHMNLVEAERFELSSFRVRAGYNWPLYDASIFGRTPGNRTQIGTFAPRIKSPVHNHSANVLNLAPSVGVEPTS